MYIHIYADLCVIRYSFPNLFHWESLAPSDLKQVMHHADVCGQVQKQPQSPSFT